jgi:hypothetical protein
MMIDLNDEVRQSLHELADEAHPVNLGRAALAGARRRRRVRLAGAAVFAALVAAPLLTLPGGNQPGPAGALPPPAERRWESHEIIVSFFDLDHGVAQYQDDACVDLWSTSAIESSSRS